MRQEESLEYTTGMIEFKIVKKSIKSRARVGILKTAHGEIETPALVPVATQAVVKTLTSEEAENAGCQILIANTFHLHLKPGEGVVKAAGGLHEFMNWKRPLMTDSGGYQVFSLGFGKDMGVGKILKFFPDPSASSGQVGVGSKPKSLTIGWNGVYFRSPLDGSRIFIGPKESIAIQEKLGADIIFAFDECTPPLSTFEYAKKALDRTHRWAKTCLEVKNSKQALFGIVQGSKYKELREESAKYINSLGFDGFGIGGDLGSSKKDMREVLDWVLPHLDEQRPRHLLGIGYLEDMEMIIKNGIDLFDCTVPTHYARHGVAFTANGKLHMENKGFLKDKEPLDKNCKCLVCQNYKRNYISHLVRAKEMTGLRLLTFHNLFFFNNFVSKIRERIKNSEI